MPSVEEGLSLEDAGTITEDPFAASFLAKQSEVADEPGAPEEPSSGPARDPQTGKFVSAGTPEGQEETPTEGVETAEPNEWQIRYEEAQKVIGRQGSELGELRARVEAVEAAKAARQEPEFVPPTHIPEELAESLVEQIGARAAVQDAINNFLDPDSQAFQAIFEAAAEAVSSQAQLADLVEMRMMYRIAYEEEPEEARQESPTAPEQEWVKKAYLENQVANAVTQIRAATPDYDALVPFFEKALEIVPHLQQEVVSNDPARITPALAAMVHVARGIASQTGAVTAQAGEDAATAAQAAKLAAQVTTGSLRAAVSEGTPVAGQDADDEFVKQFKDAFRAAASPSIQDGLTLE